MLAISLLFSQSNLQAFAQPGHHAAMMSMMDNDSVTAPVTSHDVAEVSASCGQSSDDGSSSQLGKNCCKMACAAFAALLADVDSFFALSFESQVEVFVSVQLTGTSNTSLRRPPRA
jgi:hypothetical protein